MSRGGGAMLGQAARAVTLAFVFFLSTQAPMLIDALANPPEVLEDASPVARADTLVTLTRGDCTNDDGDCDSDNVANAAEDVNGDGNWANDDTDGDGTADYLDSDDDGDGWPTWFECPDGRNSTDNHCVGVGQTYDYLHDALYNCDQPLLQVSSGTDEQDIFAYFWTNDTLVEIGTDVAGRSAAWSRSATDGKLWWVDNVRQTSGSQNVYTWDMTNGVTLVGNTGASTTYSRAAFDEDGVLYAEDNDNIYTISTTDGAESTHATNIGDTGSGGDMMAHPTNGSWYFLSATDGQMYITDDAFGNRVAGDDLDSMFGVDEEYVGATILSNGTLLANWGQELWMFTGDWANGSGSMVQLHASDAHGYGDMASCTTPYTDTDGDGLE